MRDTRSRKRLNYNRDMRHAIDFFYNKKSNLTFILVGVAETVHSALRCEKMKPIYLSALIATSTLLVVQGIRDGPLNGVHLRIAAIHVTVTLA